MGTEPWPSYIPEINSGRWEAGSGPETWMMASEVWTNFAELVLMATTGLMGEIALMTGVTLTGMTSVSMMASSVPFFAWLGELEMTALLHAAACATVAEAWATTTAGIIPLPVVNQNRITEASLEASNVFGQNSPAIAEMNREYAQFWTQDGMSMTDYDGAVQVATAPKFVSPPPPLTNMMAGSGQAMSQIGQSAGQAASNAQSMGDAFQGMTSPMESAASKGGDMSSMMGQMGQFAQMPMQAGQQLMSNNPLSQVGQLGQQMMGPLQSMMGSFAGGPQMGAGLGSSFSPASLSSSTGGLPMGGAGMGGGGGMGMGGGGGMGSLGSLGSSSDKVARPVTNLSGVPGPGLGSGNQLSGRSGAMGGGGGGMGGAGAGGQTRDRKTETILAAKVDDDSGMIDVEEERRAFA